MKAVVFHGLGDIRLETVPEPKIEKPTDAIVRLTASAICGTDLHMIRGTMPGMVPGTILGHEGVGVVEDVGAEVRDIKAGDRVVIPSTICCGHCPYCDAGYHVAVRQRQSQRQAGRDRLLRRTSDHWPDRWPPGRVRPYPARRPDAHQAAGRPRPTTGPSCCRISFRPAISGRMRQRSNPATRSRCSAAGRSGSSQSSAPRLLGAGRVFAIDTLPDRLAKARELGAETIDFNAESPVERLKDLTKGIGVWRAIDAVGVDAFRPESGPAYVESRVMKSQFKEEQKETELEGTGATWGGQWKPGNAPSQVLTWGVQALAKAGTFSIIGVYPETMTRFPIGMAMMKNLTIQMGNCPHRKYIPRLIKAVQEGKVDPLKVLTQVEPMTDAISAYKAFDKRKSGWVKVELKPAA